MAGAILSLSLYWKRKTNMVKSSVDFIFLDISIPSSFDPLDADRGVNLNAMRLLYATPIEISINNDLTSSILEAFEYNKIKREITFKVKKGLQFSDGSALTAEDVAFAIVRMAWKRPGFPVIKDIVGLRNWLQESFPLLSLPSGIVVDGSMVKIKLSQDHRSPLFRFALELFSVIPKISVNLNTGMLKQPIPVFSGYYSLAAKSDQGLIFKKRDSSKIKAVDQIKFLYANGDKNIAEEMLSQENSILYGSDVQLISRGYSSLKENAIVKWLPSSRFNFVLLNPHVAPFDDVFCRNYFMRTYRQTVKKLYGDTLAISSSIFSKIVPGYLSDEALIARSSSSVADEACAARFKKEKITMYALSSKLENMNDKILFETLISLGVQVEVKESNGIESREAMFAKNTNAFFTAESGFWAEDPIGDVKMFFTPNLHEPLKFVLQDHALSNLIDQLNEESIEINADLQQVNRTLYKEALLNVVFHSQRFFATRNKSLLKELPQAVSSPAFWQVINAE